ncbi:hypothetical protein Tco_0109003 [Tanacetum coccineum]
MCGLCRPPGILRIKIKWFDGLITLFKGDEEVTYQMARSHPRFKNHTNKQCNMIPPLLMVSDEEVTYQMARSHLRFKNHTNKQCNMIPPLLMVSDEDRRNGISHSYQKLKGFYKGVLNLGPDYIRDTKMEEYLTCGHDLENEKSMNIGEEFQNLEEPEVLES